MTSLCDFHELLSQQQSHFWCFSFFTTPLFVFAGIHFAMETFSECYVCRAGIPGNSNVFSRDLTLYSYLHTFIFFNIKYILQINLVFIFANRFPSWPGHNPDQVWRSKFLAALKFSQDIIDKPPSQIEVRRVICNRHFTASCFTEEKLLIHGSVPELFLNEIRNNDVNKFYFPY